MKSSKQKFASILSLLLGASLILGACSEEERTNDAPAPAGAENTTNESMPVSYEFFRNATAKLTYNGQTLLLDPMLSDKGALPSFAGIAPNPIIDLPVSTESILEDVDAVLVGHMHLDHFDQPAAEKIAKDTPIFTPDNEAPTDVTDPENSTQTFKAQLEQKGFTNVSTMASNASKFEGITMSQEFGQHGIGRVGQLMGGVNGIILRAEGQPTIYWTGDTVLDDEGQVEAILAKHKPDIVIVHTGGAVIESIAPDPLMINEPQAVRFFEAAERINPDVQITAVHMNALDHCFTTRDTLKAVVDKLPENIKESVYIPAEGETVEFR
ncbi:hypothetical protein C1752_03758 [Acaryochloris thomasi RCC1774]|uniref:Metallo-beta-lactamase domain-containing protein n=1 Tax=Acaryochloris thomasi RCC1774 TaxID=1764569 RepID=A0A2W1JMR0_9CYAN|nr:MBL fold metallo-hydrolase [Acaryochloris thomasi]PZD72172.1 hypothetical protein C1752_03758 [Acaryochloris thomasi RCC1774]